MRIRPETAAAAALALLLAPAFLFAGSEPAQDSRAAGDGEEALAAADVGPEHVGEEITVTGRALEVNRYQGSGFHISLPSGLLALIPESHIHLWTGVDPTKRYPGRTLQITGEVMDEDGQLFIGVTDPADLKVVPRRRRRR